MDINDKIKMSLEDIINVSTPSGSGGEKGERERIQAPEKEYPDRTSRFHPQIPSQIGAVLRGNNRRGITKSYPTKREVNGSWKRGMYEEIENYPNNGRGGNYNGSINRGYDFAKLHISNLDSRTSESDIQELFTGFGSLRSVTSSYGRFGRMAEVVFHRREDAVKIMKKYNDVPLNGQPMHIELVANSIRARLGNFQLRPHNRPPVHKPMPKRRDNREQQSLTAENLDAELDEYMAQILK